MSIFENTQLDRDYQVLKNKSEMVALNATILKETEDRHKMAFDMVWNNPNFTAQEVLNSFGNEAAALFIFSGQIQTMLKQAKPEYEILMPPLPYTINEDGTVTIN